MTVAGGIIIMISLFVGEFREDRLAGLSAELSDIAYSPDVGVDYYIWGLQIAGIGTLLSGVNLIATILKMRARPPGMSMIEDARLHLDRLLHQHPDRCLVPGLTAVLALLTLDRYVGTHFFTNTDGGSACST